MTCLPSVLIIDGMEETPLVAPTPESLAVENYEAGKKAEHDRVIELIKTEASRLARCGAKRNARILRALAADL